MTNNNGWPDKPGVPLNPERDGWHWLVCPLKHDVFPRFWRAAGEAQNCRWTAKWLYSRNDWNPKKCTYLGPALTPAELESRFSEAMKWRTAIYDALTEWHDPPRDDETPKAALRRLVHTEILAVLDPAVSRPAADLVAKARRDALEEAAEEMDCACPQRGAVLVKLAKDGPLSHHWPCEKSDDCCALRGAAIRALKGEGDD
jgi:hypothetical protein